MKYAVIDIGTNTTRLLVRDDQTPKQDVLRKVSITRLGNGLEKTGVLNEESMSTTRSCVQGYVQDAVELGVEKSNIKIFATAARK